MQKINISAVSYLNTFPFIYGLKNSKIINSINLNLDIPSICAEKLLTNKVDIGLVPVAILPKLKNYSIISDYCIGANGNVKSVLIVSNKPIEKIKTIYLDYQSRTSVNLAKVLAKHYWKKDFNWLPTQQGYENQILDENSAAVIIGDRAFQFLNKFQYQYDLSEYWKKLTGLPFVFAAWVANKEIDSEFINEFNKALSGGLNQIDNITQNNIIKFPYYDLKEYYTQNICYHFNKDKNKALQLFLKYLNEE